MIQVVAENSAGLQTSPVTFPILAITLILSAYILWRRYRSRRRLVERVAELEMLSAAGRAIVTAKLEIKGLSELVAELASLIIDTSNFFIGLFDNQHLQLVYWIRDGRIQESPLTLTIADDTDVFGTIRRSEKSMLIFDSSKEETQISFDRRVVPSGLPRSAMILPLISGARVVGVIGTFSDQPNAFTEREMGQMTILANQAAAAIANARIFHQERSKAAQLELVSRIAGRITAISDLDELLNQVVSLTQKTFGFNSVNIFGIDPENGEVFNQASSILTLKPGTIRLVQGLGLIGAAVESRKTILASNAQEDERFIGESISETTRSEVVIPLLVNEELMGVLDVQSEQIAAFSRDDQVVLEALADQIAVAILKARQFRTQTERAWIATAQLQIAEAIGKSAELTALAGAVARLTSMLVGAKYCLVLAWDDDLEAYQVLSAYGTRDDEALNSTIKTVSIGEWPALDAAHVGQEIFVSKDPKKNILFSVERDGLSEEWLIPLIFKSQLQGMIISGFEDSQIGRSVREEIINNIATQAAQGMDSIKLRQALQEEAWVNTALLQVAEAVNRLTDLNEILNSIVRLVPMLVGVRSCVVLVWDDERERYMAGPSHGISEMGYGLLESFDIDLSEFPLIERLDVERVGPEAAYYTFRLPEWMQNVMNAATANILPLRARGRLVGVLVVGPTVTGRPIAGRRLNILTGIAQQAATAVVNDQLYQESAERTRIEQELNVALSIQSSLIPAENPEIRGCTVAGFWQAARQVSGDFFDYMEFQDDCWGIAIADVAGKGIPAALFMALSRTILRTVAFNRRNPAEVLQRTNEIIYNDTTSDHFVTVFYALWDPRKNTMYFANGGHNPPIHLSSNGETKLLSSNGIALGVLSDAAYVQKSISLRKGDCVILYTDGITETMNEDYDEFGLERLVMTARNARSGTASQIVDAIRSAVEDHGGSRTLFDDTTMVVIKR